MSNVSLFLDRLFSRNTYPVLLVLFILWMCIGIFPLRCYETDGQEIILGCDIMYRDRKSVV